MRRTKSTIPPALREELGKDPEYTYCHMTGKRGTKEDPIEWHHNLRFAGNNVQERFCIIPLLHSVHRQADNKEVREQLDRIMIARDIEDRLFTAFSKAVDWRQREKYLISKYGVFTPVTPEPPATRGRINYEALGRLGA